MGAALSAKNADEVRVLAWCSGHCARPGPPAVWLAGLRALWTLQQMASVRFLVPTFGLLVLFTVVGGTQPHYPPPAWRHVRRRDGLPRRASAQLPRWRRAASINAGFSAIISLPLLPQTVLGATPIPAMNQLIADQVGWPTYAEQIQTANDARPAARRASAVVVTSNYGEAVPSEDSPTYRSTAGTTPCSTWVRHLTPRTLWSSRAAICPLPHSCSHRVPHRRRLDNGLGVDNEESREQPIASVCTDHARRGR